MLASLVATNPPESLHVHLLRDESLPPEVASALGDLVRAAGGVCDVIDVPLESREQWPDSDRFPANAWYRVRLAELLGDLPRVLYVDADVLMTARLDELWATDLGGCVLGAVTQYLYPAMIPRVQNELDLPGISTYFNSGVLLIDLARWRADRITDAIKEYVSSHMLVWPDQDSLSGVLHSRHHYLHPRWNAMPGIWELSPRHLPYPAHEVREAAADPAIVHFLGPHKPWHYRCKSRYRADWFRYLEQTPWAGRAMEGRSIGHALLRPLPLLWAYNVEAAISRWPALARLGGASMPSRSARMRPE